MGVIIPRLGCKRSWATPSLPPPVVAGPEDANLGIWTVVRFHLGVPKYFYYHIVVTLAYQYNQHVSGRIMSWSATWDITVVIKSQRIWERKTVMSKTHKIQTAWSQHHGGQGFYGSMSAIHAMNAGLRFGNDRNSHRIAKIKERRARKRGDRFQALRDIDL